MTKSKCETALKKMTDERDHWRNLALGRGIAETATYQLGYDEGWKECHDKYWTTMQPLNDRYFTLYVAIAYTMGIATAGFGNVPLEMLSVLGGQIADASKRLEFEVERIEQESGENLGLNLTDANQVSDALKVMYSGKDSQGDNLRAVASSMNPTMRRNIELRPLLAPGAKKEQEIDWLCKRVLDIQHDNGFNRVEATNALELELRDNPTGIKLLALQKWESWSKSDPFGNLWKNVERRGKRGKKT